MRKWQFRYLISLILVVILFTIASNATSADETLPAGMISSAVWSSYDSSPQNIQISLSDISANESITLVLKDGTGEVLSTMECIYNNPLYVYLYDNKQNILHPQTGEVTLLYSSGNYYVQASVDAENTPIYRSATAEDFSAVSFIPKASEWVDYIKDTNSVKWYLTNHNTWVFTTTDGSYHMASEYLTYYASWPIGGILYPQGIGYCHYDIASASWSSNSTVAPDGGFPVRQNTFPCRSTSATATFTPSGIQKEIPATIPFVQTEWTPTIAQVPTSVELIVDGQLLDRVTRAIDAKQWAYSIAPISKI